MTGDGNIHHTAINYQRSFYIILTYYNRKIQYIQGIQLSLNNRLSFFMLFLLRSPDITITKWHMPFVRQQLMWAMEETFWKKGGVKFANINLVSNWTAKFQLNELPFKCRRPWLHTFNPRVNLIWSQEPYKGTTHWLIKRTEGRWE